MIRIVTVPLDLTAESDRAITPGVVLAQQLGAGLELVVVTSPGLDTGPDQYELQARAAQLVGVVTSTGVVEADDAVEGLQSLAADPERLVVMASHGRGRLGQVVAPSVALSLIHTAHRPAVVIGPRQDWWPGPVGALYVAVDERGVPHTTLALVDEWAAAFGAEVAFVQAQAPDRRADRIEPGSLGIDDACGWMEGRGRRVSVRHLAGEPALTLADAADRAARLSPLLVVTGRVGSHRDRVLHGSVTGRLISVSPVPTLVVPAVVAPGREHRADLTVAES